MEFLIAKAMSKLALFKQVPSILVLLGITKIEKVQHEPQDLTLFERDFIINLYFYNFISNKASPLFVQNLSVDE